jgi:hypothetical protein
MSRVVYIAQVFEISGVGQCIEIYNLQVWLFVDQLTDERRSNESGSARDEHGFHFVSIRSIRT